MFFLFFLGYSKSNILDMAELIAEAAATYFPQMEDNKVVNGESYDAATTITTTTTTTTNVLNQEKCCKNFTKMVFNDGTPAGILSNLKQSTRTMHLHEADVTLKSFGLLLPSPCDITPTKIDPFRSTLMTLYEKPGHFRRVLKKEKIDVSGSKLNVFVSSGNNLFTNSAGIPS
jgi:hypothetical protein